MPFNVGLPGFTFGMERFVEVGVIRADRLLVAIGIDGAALRSASPRVEIALGHVNCGRWQFTMVLDCYSSRAGRLTARQTSLVGPDNNGLERTLSRGILEWINFPKDDQSDVMPLAHKKISLPTSCLEAVRCSD